MANSQVRADKPDGSGFGCTLRPDSVIDRCGFETARKRVMSQQQQGQAVGPARDSQTYRRWLNLQCSPIRQKAAALCAINCSSTA